jgi:hypothetical protein
MLAADDNFRRLLLLLDDVNAGSARKHNAPLPFHRLRRAAMVETGERSLMRFRPGRAKPGVWAHKTTSMPPLFSFVIAILIWLGAVLLGCARSSR